MIAMLLGIGRGHLGNSGEVRLHEPPDRGRGHDVVKAARDTGEEKEWFADDAWLSSDCSASNDIPLVLKKILQQMASPALRSRRGPQSLVVRHTKSFSSSVAWWNKPLNGRYPSLSWIATSQLHSAVFRTK